MRDFIRKNASGELDFEKSLQIVRELSAVANYHTDHNILLDLRETSLSIETMDEVMKIVIEFVQNMPSFKNKIANVIPNDANRVASAEHFENCMNIHKFRYKFFTDFEEAIDWLSDVMP